MQTRFNSELSRRSLLGAGMALGGLTLAGCASTASGPSIGRVVVVGFTGGSIPEVKVNRLLLKNTSVVGAGWGEWALSNPGYVAETGAEIAELVDGGFVRPIVGARFPMDQAAEALKLIDGRGATGKVVLETG